MSIPVQFRARIARFFSFWKLLGKTLVFLCLMGVFMGIFNRFVSQWMLEPLLMKSWQWQVDESLLYFFCAILFALPCALFPFLLAPVLVRRQKG